MSKRKAKSQEFIDDSDDPDDTGDKTKKAKLKQAAASAKQTDTDEEMIPLSTKRFVGVRSFRGKIIVDIREYYEDNTGEMKPGKKGIALSLDQWEKLKSSIDIIDEKIHNSS